MPVDVVNLLMGTMAQRFWRDPHAGEGRV